MGSPKSYEILTGITAATLLSSAVYNPQEVFPESLTNGALTSGTSWTGAGDFSSAGNAAVYTHNTGAGTYTQAVTALARTGRSVSTYEFTYTVSSPADAAPTIVISTAFAQAAASLTNLGTAGTYKIRFTSATTPGAFVLSGTSVAAGTVTLDNLSLVEIVNEQDRMQVKRAVISVETAAVNFTVDGTTPTVTSGTYQGHLLNPNDVLTLNDIAEIRQFRCINAVASNGAVVKVTYSFL
jgi:hypothetical protein